MHSQHKTAHIAVSLRGGVDEWLLFPVVGTPAASPPYLLVQCILDLSLPSASVVRWLERETSELNSLEVMTERTDPIFVCIVTVVNEVAA